MGILNKFRKRDEVIDYTDRSKYAFRKAPSIPTTRKSQIKSTPYSSSSSFNSSSSPTTVEPNAISFLSDLSQASPTSEISSIEDPKERLKQRLLNMTEQIEDLSNQLYRLNQRLEALEQKLKSGRDYLG